LLNILETGGIIEGSASEILEQIEKRAEFDGTLNELKKDKRFPKNASALARRFTTYEPLLRDAGITHQEKRTGQKRIHSFYYTPTPEGNETDEIPV
jgi:23S rRNA C2498 (ribose-2'-O)-methylase RlmM